MGAFDEFEHFGPQPPGVPLILVADKEIAMALRAYGHNAFRTFRNEKNGRKEWLFSIGVIDDIKRIQLGDLKVDAKELGRLLAEELPDGE